MLRGAQLKNYLAFLTPAAMTDAERIAEFEAERAELVSMASNALVAVPSERCGMTDTVPASARIAQIDAALARLRGREVNR